MKRQHIVLVITAAGCLLLGALATINIQSIFTENIEEIETVYTQAILPYNEICIDKDNLATPYQVKAYSISPLLATEEKSKLLGLGLTSERLTVHRMNSLNVKEIAFYELKNVKRLQIDKSGEVEIKTYKRAALRLSAKRMKEYLLFSSGLLLGILLTK